MVLMEMVIKMVSHQKKRKGRNFPTRRRRAPVEPMEKVKITQRKIQKMIRKTIQRRSSPRARRRKPWRTVKMVQMGPKSPKLATMMKKSQKMEKRM